MSVVALLVPLTVPLRNAISEVLRLTGATLARLFDQAESSVERVQLALDRLPTLIELEAVLRVLIDGGLAVLTLPRAMGDAARELVRQIAGFAPSPARPKGPNTGYGSGRGRGGSSRRMYKAPLKMSDRQSAPTVDIFLRKGKLAPNYVQPLPEVPTPRRLGLKYFGSKLKLVGQTLPYVLCAAPVGTTIISPFCGGLHVESALARLGYQVKASDRHADLINMWKVIKEHRSEFTEAALRLLAETKAHPEPKRLLYDWRDGPTPIDLIERAARTATILRASFFGTHGNGFVDCERLTSTSIESLAGFYLRGISIEQADFRDQIDRAAPADFLYLDPPYKGLHNLYPGRDWTGQDYLDLFDRIRDRQRWLVHLNRTGDVLALFAGFPMIEIPVYYSTTNTTEIELIILPRRR